MEEGDPTHQPDDRATGKGGIGWSGKEDKQESLSNSFRSRRMRVVLGVRQKALKESQLKFLLRREVEDLGSGGAVEVSDLRQQTSPLDHA